MFGKHGHSLTPRGSKRQKFTWALRGKEKRIAQVAQFSSLVDDLHSLVSIDGDRDGLRNTLPLEPFSHRCPKSSMHEVGSIDDDILMLATPNILSK